MLWRALAALALLGPVLPGQDDSGAGRKYALLIGVAKYTAVPPLSYCERDVEAMRRTLVEQGGYAERDVLVLSTAEARDGGRWPNRANILNAIDQHLRGKRPEDTILLYFSGHGVAPEEGDLEDYLMPVDALSSPERVPNMCLSYSQLYRDLQRSGAGEVVVIVDACRVATKGAAPTQRDDIEQAAARAAQERGVVLLRSCRYGEVSREATEFGQGVYTHFLTKALAGDADGYGPSGVRDGQVTAYETHDYMHAQVLAWAEKAGAQQTPTINRGEEATRRDIVLTRVTTLEQDRQLARLGDLEAAGMLGTAEAAFLRRGLAGQTKDAGEAELVALGRLMLGEKLQVEEYLEAAQIVRGELTGQYAEKMRDQVAHLAERGAEHVETYRQVKGVLVEERRPAQKGTLEGRVIDAGGTGIAGATVSLVPGDVEAVMTGAAGRYRFTGVAYGQYIVQASHPEYRRGLSTQQTLGTAQAQVEDILLEPLAPAVTTGSLVLSVDPEVVEVRIGGRYHGRTDQGALTIEGLPAGQVQVELRAEGYEPMARPATIQAGLAATLKRTAPVGPVAGQERVNPTDGAVMVWVPGTREACANGKFRMSSTPEAIDRLWQENGWDASLKQWTADQQPAHDVELDGFWIYKHEVTNGQYAKFLTATGHAAQLLWDALRDHANLPVVDVTWDDAAAYCLWAGVELPTEAQWEYAARGPDGHSFPWGDQWDRSRCNSAELHAGRPLADYDGWKAWYEGIGAWADGDVDKIPSVVAAQYLRDVGSLPGDSSWCGATDMAGNAYEWCRDRYDERFYGTAGAGQPNPECTDNGSGHRVVRGGGWGWPAREWCSAGRNWDSPVRHNCSRGFRAALTR